MKKKLKKILKYGKLIFITLILICTFICSSIIIETTNSYDLFHALKQQILMLFQGMEQVIVVVEAIVAVGAAAHHIKVAVHQGVHLPKVVVIVVAHLHQNSWGYYAYLFGF